MLSGLEIDWASVAEQLSSRDVEVLEKLAVDDDSVLARRATVAAGALARRLSEGGDDGAVRASKIVMAAAGDHRYRVRLAAVAASDDLPLPQRNAVRVALLCYPDEPDDSDGGNYIVQVAVLKAIERGPSEDSSDDKLRKMVENLRQSSPAESVRNRAREALNRTGTS